MSSKALMEEVERLKTMRKQGEITVMDFYRELLGVAIKMAEELQLENISEDEVKKQIPLVLTFIEDQLRKMRDRGS